MRYFWKLMIKLVVFFFCITPFFWTLNIVEAHWVTWWDKWYLEEVTGTNIIPFIYLWAKHMVTWYDHILFLVGIIFFLYKRKDIITYVTLFGVWHSITLLFWVFADISINAFFIDAIIWFSIVYKWLDNIGAYKRWFWFQPNTKLATLVFGLFHWFGLATKVQEYSISPDGLLANLISFNVWVEIWQILALSLVIIAMWYWRRTEYFKKYSYDVNVGLMVCGFILVGYQLVGFFIY